MAVLPVPMPRKVRPGASRWMVAMALAVTGASRVGAMATPVPIFIVRVCCATSASVAQQSENTICVSVTQAWL
jgi:hypothetical protein